LVETAFKKQAPESEVFLLLEKFMQGNEV